MSGAPDLETEAHDAWDESILHAFLAARLPGTPLEGGDRRAIHDAVVLELGSRLLATCCDRTEEGVHFTRQATMQAVAHKAVGRALSDLAATAAVPRGILLALAAPRGFSGALLEELLEAVLERGIALGAPLLGGDLTAAGQGLSLVVTALGEAPSDPPGRDRLAVGDVVALTGPVGGSRLGRHLWIEPRIAEGLRLYAAGARAMMDVSDGLALDLSRLARASGVVLELGQVPVHPDAAELGDADEQAALEHALFDGEDHELLVGLPEAEALALGLLPVARVCTATAERPAGLWLPDDLAAGGRAPLSAAPRTWAPFDPTDPRSYVHGR